MLNKAEMELENNKNAALCCGEAKAENEEFCGALEKEPDCDAF